MHFWLVQELKHATKSKTKKVLKARVMQLQQEITASTAAVDDFGEKAKTAFARAIAKEKAQHKASAHKKHSRHDGGRAHGWEDSADGDDSSDHNGWGSSRAESDAQRLRADGWH